MQAPTLPNFIYQNYSIQQQNFILPIKNKEITISKYSPQDVFPPIQVSEQFRVGWRCSLQGMGLVWVYLLQKMAYFRLHYCLQFYNWKSMNSQQSSFRDMYVYPQEGNDQRIGKSSKKVSRSKKSSEINKPTKQSFYDIVQKAKNVAVFTQTLKNKIAEKRTLNTHTLKQTEMAFLQNDSQVQSTHIYFEHDDRIVVTLQVLFIIIINIYLWKATFEIGFGQPIIQQPLFAIATLVVYLVHIVMFNLSSYKNQKLQIISNRNQIQQLYFSNKIAFDIIFVSTLIVQLTPLDQFHWAFITVRLVSLVVYQELKQTREKVENLFSVSSQAEISIAMFNLLSKIGLFLHFLSVALNLLAQIESQYLSQTWLTGNSLQYSSNFDKYIIAWYWGATILSTVGFGEITPKNNYQRFFISIVQIICCMTIGYFVNVIGSLIKMRAESEEKHEKEIRSLNRCLNFFSPTNDLKHKIRTHYFNRHMIEKIHDPNEEKQLLQNLTPNLQKTLLQTNNINVLNKTSLMQQFKQETLLKFAHFMKKVILAPQHILYSRNSVDRKLWFIQNGNIEEFTDNFENSTLRKTIFSYNQNNSIVGWINFITQSAYKTMAKAKIFTIAYQLEQEGFLSALKDNPNDYHRFMHIKHQTLEKNRKYIHKCISCDRYTHNVINCPRIHFVRKDIVKLAQQNKHLHNYVNEQHKKKKYNRMKIRYNWKIHFGNGQLQKQANLLMNNDSIRISNTSDNIFKNVLFRESVLSFERRKMSFLISKKQSYNQTKQMIKENNRESNDKSLPSCDEVMQPFEELIYDSVFFNKENNDYMPEHDVQKVTALYSNKFTKKLDISDKIKRFVKKHQH